MKVKKLMAKMKYLVKGEKKECDNIKELSRWQEKFSTAYAQYNKEEFDTLELVYLGTKETVKNVNVKSNQPVKKANNVPNIVYELIESEVNTATPEANVKSKKPGFEEQAKMIQEKIMSDFADMNIEAISDKNERNTYVHGISAVVCHWNTMLGNHEYLGEKELFNYHPKQIVPQPNVYDIKKMDYIFFVASTTKEDVKRRTGIDVSDESEQYPESNQIGSEGSGVSKGDTVTEIWCLYKDDEGDIGKFAWVGDTVIENKPKYFYPRVEVCNVCGYENPQGEKECVNCGNKKLSTSIITEETINEDMELSPISYAKPVKRVVENANGKRVEVKTEQVIIERKIPAGTKVPIPAPKDFPVAIRINIPKNFSFRGRSDVETIRDQQECVKKVWSKAEDKVLNGGGIVLIDEKLNRVPTNAPYQVWKGKKADIINGVYKVDFTHNIQQDVEFALKNYDRAKSTLGITDSFQGKYDPSAKSGKAKEVQVEQASGRLQSKIKNKFTFYADMFRIMFYFDLCFTNEARPYITTSPKGDDVYKEFSKYELLCQDKSGQWYYNTDFRFKADLGSNLPQDKTFLYEQTVMMYQSGAMDKEQFWEILATLNYPIANRILEQTRQHTDEQLKMVLEEMKGMPPEQQVAFLQLPIDEQLDMIQEMGGQDGMQQM